MARYEEDVKKARGGDREAVEIVIMLAPRGATKGMTDEQYIEKLDTDADFADKVYGASGPMGSASFDGADDDPMPTPSRLTGIDPKRACELHDAGVIEIKDPEELERLRKKVKPAEEKEEGDPDDLLPDFGKRRDMSDAKGVDEEEE